MRVCSRTRGAARGGFTLIEVLLAMTLAAIIMAALFALFDNVSGVQKHVSRHFDRSRTMRVVFGVMEDDLRSMLPANDTTVLASVDNAGFGQDTSLFSMLTAASLRPGEQVPPLGLNEVEYVLRGDSGHRRLVRRERPHAGIRGDFEDTEVVLADDVARVEVGFFDSSYHEFRKDWDPSNLGTTLPAAVRVRLTLGDANNQEEYELVIPLSPSL